MTGTQNRTKLKRWAGKMWAKVPAPVRYGAYGVLGVLGILWVLVEVF